MSSDEIQGTPASMVKASYWYPDGETPESITSAENIPSALFTHLFCAYADLAADTYRVYISRKHDYMFSTFTDTVKIGNKQVKTLLSIGGRNANNSAFASMASRQHFREMFIDSWIRIARSYGFHGLDLAWEYPNSDAEMNDFGDLVRDLRDAVDAEHSLTNRPILLLTAAVYYSPVYKKFTYPVKVMKDSLDWVNITAYDFCGPSSTLGLPACLYNPWDKDIKFISYYKYLVIKHNLIISYDPYMCIFWSNSNKIWLTDPCGDSGLKQWIEAGLPERKTVFGFSYHGWSWSWNSEDDKDHGNDPAAITRGQVAVTPNGSVSYSKIKEFIKDYGATTEHDKEVVEDNCFSKETLIRYDDTQSVVTKVRYIKSNDLLGYFAWNVGADDNTLLSTAASQAWDAS
ncbi:PREDICTED: chitinase-3-like protein 2 [Camelina sativa]|uniref:Chitinase-3-like protein 2 n=1 Tax=Camelina sativa TaxID=90675 RepID=A0ABM1QKU8_CAMSA|nr:PREDICTED: chitinase-3-like protein 2 [Camelina sativa]